MLSYNVEPVRIDSLSYRMCRHLFEHLPSLRKEVLGYYGSHDRFVACSYTASDRALFRRYVRRAMRNLTSV